MPPAGIPTLVDSSGSERPSDGIFSVYEPRSAKKRSKALLDRADPLGPETEVGAAAERPALDGPLGRRYVTT
jgi:hypothetical protein